MSSRRSRGVTHVHREARPAFDRRRHVLAADRRHDDVLHGRDREAVAGELVAPQVEVDEVAAGDALGKRAARARNVAERASRSRSRRARSSARSAPKTLIPTGVRTPVVSMSIRALIGIVQAFVWPGHLQRPVHLGDQLVPGDVGPRQTRRRRRPSATRAPRTSTSAACARHSPSGFRDDGRLHHRERRGVGRGLGSARLAEDALDLREGLAGSRSWSCSRRCGLASTRDAGEGRRHVEDRCPR